MTFEEYKAFRDALPSQPGIYKYLGENDEIMYIGKAKDLKKRVSSYFTKTDHTRRIRQLVTNIQKIEFVIVDTEQDALLLENSLIKKYQPKYNVMLKDDKTYPFICIKKEPFPRVFFTRKIIRDGSEYLGPYTSVFNAKIILDLLKQIFPLRTCNLALTPKNIEAGKFKVCLEYHIKNCLGPCQNLQTKEDYDEEIQQIRDILKSNFGSVKYYLKKKMNEYAADMQFERAEEFREKIELLTGYANKSTIVNARLTDIDVYGYTESESAAFINYLKIANGTVVKTRALEIKKVLDEPKEELILRAVAEYTLAENEGLTEVILPFEIEEEFEKIKVTVPQAGDKKRLLDLAVKNALYMKMEKLKQGMTAEEKKPAFRIMRTLKEDLKLKELPVHIECFDNSNIQGTNPVSACVVFKNAKPSKKDYRHFNIRTVEGPDDFASMHEVITRRYKRLMEEDQPLPQLIIVDGGKGQLSSAVDALKQLGLYGRIPIVGIAKRLEEIYFPEDTLPLYINKKSESLKLIQQMRDEAHRFGITHHRDRRSKTQATSALTEIKGIGDKTFELLLKKYRSVKKLKEVPLEELSQVIGPAKAKIVLEALSMPDTQTETTPASPIPGSEAPNVVNE
ncbi:MAG TPA: excinuclease ABC subunit UvrC [Chitinophagales bacterium]|nr:excinuclease ABC subunit UvrC [Chitinophagales bacterium]